jgi:hypothetical protein
VRGQVALAHIEAMSEADAVLIAPDVKVILTPPRIFHW